MKKIAIYGASGHGKVIAEIVEELNYKVIAFIDDREKKEVFEFKSINYKKFKKKFLNLNSHIEVIIAIGNNKIREKIFRELIKDNIKIATLIHPKAIISKRAKIDIGTVVMAGVIVNAEAKIGKCVILNSSSVIEHENIINDFVHISPNVSLAGNVTIGKFSHIGIGATLIQGIKIGENSIIGAGSVVINNIEDNLKVVGVPAKRVLSK